jgi:N-formylglutamate amidohydrolase
VLNGRFKGGYITRGYGLPQQNVHAIQLELAQCTYMEEALPYGFDEDKAEQVRPVLRALVSGMLEWAASQR